MRRKLLKAKTMGVLAVFLVCFMTAGVAEEILRAGHYAYTLKDGLATIVGHIDSEYGWQYWFDDRPDTRPSLLVEDEPAGFPSAADGEGAAANNTLMIPERLNGYPVVAIGGVRDEGAFAEGAYTDITIPEGVVSIEDQVFSHCYYLGALTIPASVTSIGEDAFVGISGFGYIVLRVTEGSYAARYARENEIPYTYDAQFKFISSGDWLYTLEDDTATIYGFLGRRDDNGNVTIPDHLDGYPVTAIKYGAWLNAFCRKALTGVTIPQGVLSIGDEVFSECIYLSRVVFPEGVTSIGNYVFHECRSLTAVVIPASVTFIGEDAFSGCGDLTLTVPKGSYAAQYAKENGLPYIYP